MIKGVRGIVDNVFLPPIQSIQIELHSFLLWNHTPPIRCKFLKFLLNHSLPNEWITEIQKVDENIFQFADIINIQRPENEIMLNESVIIQLKFGM